MPTKTDRKTELIKIEANKVDRSPDAFTSFINNTRFGHTKYDIQMVCGQVVLSVDSNYTKTKEIGTLSMSPQHAKAVHTALGEALGAYEAEYGSISDVSAREG